MKALYKISFICVIFFALASLLFSFAYMKNNSTLREYGNSKINILCMGIDEVANNTDTMILVSVDIKEKSVCLLHIPRDTYFERSTQNNKINNIYSTRLSQTDKDSLALSLARDSISQAFSVPIDFYFSFGLDSVAEVVDGIGGVEINIPFDMNYTDEAQNLNINLKKGTHLLSGEEALLFIRYRDTYLEGDIGRIDAQKIFISAFINKAKKALTPAAIVSIAKKSIQNFQTDMSAKAFLSLCKSFAANSYEFSISYITLPGESAKDNSDTGLWYYVLNREATIDVLKKYYSQDFVPDNFDREKLFANEKNITFENIYFAQQYEYMVYSDEQISQIDIKLE